MAYRKAQWMPAKRRSKTDENRLFRIYTRAALLYLAPLLGPLLLCLIVTSVLPLMWGLLASVVVLPGMPITLFFGFRNMFATKDSPASTLLGEIELPLAGTQIEAFPAIVICRRDTGPTAATRVLCDLLTASFASKGVN